MGKENEGVRGDKAEGGGGLNAPLASWMDVDFLYNDSGGIWLLHGKPLPDILKWVEYDAGLENVSLIMRSGAMIDMGLKVPAADAAQLQRAKEITVICLQGGKIADFCVVPVNVTGAAVN